MIACLLLAVMLAFGSFALAPVPVARAVTTWTYTWDGSYQWLEKFSDTAWYLRAGAVSGNNGTLGAPLVMTAGSPVLTVNGVSSAWEKGSFYLSNYGDPNFGPFGIYVKGTKAGLESGYHTITVSWSAYQVVSNGYWKPAGDIFVYPAGSVTWAVNGGVLLSPLNYGAVSITGASSVAINVTSSYTATITGGIPPFTGHWTLTGAQTAVGPTATVVGTTSVLAWTFGSNTGLQNIRYDVTDSSGASAYDLIDVLVGSYAPQLKGQLYFSGDELRFCLYPQASNPLGEYVEPGTENVMNTDDYTIDRVILGTEWAYYRLADVAPLANPYIVHVSYVDPTNGRVYPYTFTFDTTLMAGGGDWGQGDGSHGGGELPSWLQGLRDIMKEGLQALFVPNDVQMNLLLPSGTLGASLLEGTTWGTGSSTWNMHVHWGASEIVLVNMNFATVADYGFVRAIRYAIQAGVSLGLVYLIVVLI